jgi:hypothetical protein
MSTLNNPGDNSSVLPINAKEDLYVATRNGSLSEAEDATKYIKYLKELASIQKGTEVLTVDGIDIPLKSLVPQQSEFDRVRMKTIALFNKLGPDHPIVKNIMQDVNTNSIFEASTEFTSFALGRARADDLYALVVGNYNDGSDKSVFEGLIKGDAAAIKAVSDKKVNIGNLSNFRKT